MDEVLLRRLLGALVLIALVFGLTWLLPRPRSPAPAEPGMRVVEVDVSGTEPIVLPPSSTASRQADGQVGAQAEASDPVETLTEPRAEPDVDSGDGRELAQLERPSDAAPAPPKPPGLPVASDPAAAAVRPAPAGKPAPMAGPPEAAKPAVPKPAPVLPPPASGSRWVVQVGSYAELGNARRAQAQLRSLGYVSSLSPIKTAAGTRYRVRTGSFSSREDAEVALHRLQRAKVSGSVMPDG